jgi:hypothetical protein
MHRRCRPVALPGFPPSRSNQKTVSSTPLLSEQVLASIWRIPWVLFSLPEAAGNARVFGDEKRDAAVVTLVRHTRLQMFQEGAPLCMPERHHKATVAGIPMAVATLWIKKQRTRFQALRRAMLPTSMTIRMGNQSPGSSPLTSAANAALPDQLMSRRAIPLTRIVG